MRACLIELLIGMLALLCLPVASLAAEPSTAVYDTYAPAKKLITAIEPLLSSEDKITGYGHKLFVKASLATQQEVEQLLAEIDRLPKNILITIRYREGQISNLENEKLKIKVFKGSSQQEKIEVEQVERYRLATNKGDFDNSIKVLEGNSARLNLGKEYPDQEWLLIAPLGASFHASSRQLGQELIATPVITNGFIKLDLYAANRQLGQQQTTTKATEVSATLLLEPGLWTPIASSHQVKNDDRSSHSISTRDRNNLTIDIRADIIN